MSRCSKTRRAERSTEQLCPAGAEAGRGWPRQAALPTPGTRQEPPDRPTQLPRTLFLRGPWEEEEGAKAQRAGWRGREESLPLARGRKTGLDTQRQDREKSPRATNTWPGQHYAASWRFQKTHPARPGERHMRPEHEGRVSAGSGGLAPPSQGGSGPGHRAQPARGRGLGQAEAGLDPARPGRTREAAPRLLTPREGGSSSLLWPEEYRLTYSPSPASSPARSLWGRQDERKRICDGPPSQPSRL